MRPRKIMGGWLGDEEKRWVTGWFVSCRCRLTSPFVGFFCLPRDFFHLCARPVVAGGGRPRRPLPRSHPPLTLPARPPFSPPARARAYRPESLGFCGGAWLLKKRRSPPSMKRLRFGRAGGARSVRRAFLCAWSVIIGCFPLFWGSGVVPVASLPLGPQSRARPPPALRYAKKLGKKKMGSCVWCGVPRRALLQPSL